MQQLPNITIKISQNIITNKKITIKIRYISFSCTFKILPNIIIIKIKEHSNPKLTTSKPISLEQMQTPTKPLLSCPF